MSKMFHYEMPLYFGSATNDVLTAALLETVSHLECDAVSLDKYFPYSASSAASRPTWLASSNKFKVKYQNISQRKINPGCSNLRRYPLHLHGIGQEQIT
jgi:hypothetical protein